MNKNILILLCFIPFLVLHNGCYTFKDASIDPNIETVHVEFFPNNAQLINPNLSQEFTEGLKDKIINESRLTHVRNGGDVVFEGSITGYEYAPVSLSGDQTASQNRLKITVQVEYVNFVNEEESWSSTFSAYEDFDSNENFNSVENELVETIIGNLVDDIFNKAFVNW